MEKRGEEAVKDVLGMPLENSNKKIITVLVAAIILVVVAIFVLLLYTYLQTPEHKLSLGANIEEAKISEDGKTSYIRLAGESDKNITKIKFIFKDIEGKEYNYETSEGTQEISVPFKRSFWDWLLRREKYEGRYDYEIKADEINLNNFQSIEEVSVVFEYKTETNQTIITPPLDVETNITKPTPRPTPSPGGGGGGSGPGTEPCTPKTCTQLEKQCGSWDDGCGGMFDCGSCNRGFCSNGKCITGFPTEPMIFIEEFDNQTYISSTTNSELNNSFAYPTLEITGQKVLPNPNTMIVMHFENDSSVGENSMFAYDWSGNGNTASLNGVSYEQADGVYDKYLHFDNPSDSVVINSIYRNIPITHKNGLTISLWARNNNASNTWQYIFKIDGRSTRFSGTNTIRQCVSDSYCTNYDVVQPYNWYHIVTVVNGTKWSLYVNGSYVGSIDGGIGLQNFSSTYGFNIGGTHLSGIDINIDELTIWNKVLTADEIKAVYEGKRMTGDVESKEIKLGNLSYFVNMSLKQEGFEPIINFSADFKNWCEIKNNAVLKYFECGLPSDKFWYKVNFQGMSKLDQIKFVFSGIPDSCEDKDNDSYDNWDGIYPHCVDDGKIQDCNDNNKFIYPLNTNNYCDCDSSDSFAQGCDDESCGNCITYCRDGIDNDCDGLVDYNDSDCACDPLSDENIELGFTGIDVMLKGSKNNDYVVERLWYDKSSDDDVVIYMNTDNTDIKLEHNENNLKGGGLLAYTAHLKDRDYSRGQQPSTSIYVEVREEIRKAKNNELDFNISTYGDSSTFNLIIDDLTTPGIDEQFNGLTFDIIDTVNSNLVDLKYVGSSLKREIDMPRNQSQRIHSGDIYYKIDGDKLRTGYDYTSTPADGAGDCGAPVSPTMGSMLNQPNPIFFRYNGSFNLKNFKGRIGDNGFLEYHPNKTHYGIIDSFGDEWHIITFWDNDYTTNCDVDRRDDGSSDGKIVYFVFNPKTPIISFETDEGEEFYTTPAKTYYTSFIFNQTTYLTSGVKMILRSIKNDDNIYYRVDGGNWNLYSGKITASAIFSENNRIYNFEYKIGDSGQVKLRKIHYNPNQPAQNEIHPKLAFANWSEVEERKWLVHGGDYNYTKAYKDYLYYILSDTTDFRSGLRNLNYSEVTGYFYLFKSISYAINNFAYYGVIENNETFLKKAKDALLFFYTIDPISCESGKGRDGGPCQERCMYSDSRISLNAPIGYDLLFNYTTDNGYRFGMTPIQHIKIRDNMASEAAIMTKYTGTWPEDFWQSESLSEGSPREVQLEAAITSFALAMPSYDTEYYGTSGADGTVAKHLNAPLVDAPIAWIDLNQKGLVVHPTNSSLKRYSDFVKLIDEDGFLVSGTKPGYIFGMMMDDVPTFLKARANFDGYHYERFEKFLRSLAYHRYPFNGYIMQLTNNDGTGFNGKTDLTLLINKKFPDAGIYKWFQLTPTEYKNSWTYYLIDDSIPLTPPKENSIVTKNYAVFSKNLSDTNTTFFRIVMLSAPHIIESGSTQNYWGGHFNIIAYGENLVIDLGWGGDALRSSMPNKYYNVVMLDNKIDNNYQQVRGNVISDLVSEKLDYVIFFTNHSNSPYSSSYAQKNVNLKRGAFFIDKKYIVMVDRLFSKSTHNYTFMLHGAQGNSSFPGSSFTFDDVEDKALWTKPSGVKLLAQFINPVQLSSGKEFDYIELNNESYIKAEKNGTNVDFLTVLYPLDNGQQEPNITKFNGINYYASKVENEDGKLIISVHNDSSLINVENMETNAEIALIKLNLAGEVDYYLIINGSYLNYDGVVYVNEASFGNYHNLIGTSSSLSPFTQLLNFLKGLLTRETGKAILTGNAIAENIEKKESENFFIKIIDWFKSFG